MTLDKETSTITIMFIVMIVFIIILKKGNKIIITNYENYYTVLN